MVPITFFVLNLSVPLWFVKETETCYRGSLVKGIATYDD